jgi:hypothetical protein
MLIVFDLDETLADTRHRQHLLVESELATNKVLLGQKQELWERFFKACGNDAPIPWTIKLFQFFRAKATSAKMVILTGRSEICRPQTMKWLKQYGIRPHLVLFRRANDERHDVSVKPELLTEARKLLKDSKVWFIVEDRAIMVQTWRKQGYEVLQCADTKY